MNISERGVAEIDGYRTAWYRLYYYVTPVTKEMFSSFLTLHSDKGKKILQLLADRCTGIDI